VEDPRERQILDLVAAGKTLAEMSLQTRCSVFEVASCLDALSSRGLVALESVGDESAASTDTVGAILELNTLARRLLEQGSFDAALQAYEEVLTLDRLNQEAKKGLIAIAEARQQDRLARRVPLDKVPVLKMASVALTREKFDAQEGFVLSRVNGDWNVRSILKLCPMSHEEALRIFGRLLDRKVIELR
jgi:hypothetical protein